MGFLKRQMSLEKWLQGIDVDSRVLADREYAAISKRWKSTFESYINQRISVQYGDKAMISLDSQLPTDLYIFNLPGNKLLPAFTCASEPAYCYCARGLKQVERELFNRIDAIVCNEGFDFTCIYTHEFGSLVHPEYYEAV